jgi:hypothetical protein
VTQEELSILSTLDRLVFQPATLAAIRQSGAKLAHQLESKPAAAFVRAELHLSLYGAGLPEGIHSSNIYVIRPRVTSGVERHPNSHQRSMSLDGRGAFHLGLGEHRKTYPLAGIEGGDITERWASIPPLTWHEAVAGAEPWTVVTFHTAPDGAIINERM